MNEISQIDLGSAILFLAVIAGFLATGLVFVRFAIIGINYISSKIQESKNEKVNYQEKETKGF
tara:strand:+ start:322 stop:510 length:189 start_codon:yes stop_codon:yes gene_type:complete